MSANDIALSYVGLWIVAHIVIFSLYYVRRLHMNWNSLTDPTKDSPELPELNVQVLFYYKDGDKYFLGRLLELQDMKIWESDHKMHFPLAAGKITHWTPFDRVQL